MNEKEKKAIKDLKKTIEYYNKRFKENEKITSVLVDNFDVNNLFVLLNLIEKQQAEIRQYEKALHDQIIKDYDMELKLKAEIEKQDKIIDEMAKYIVTDIKNAIIVKDICRNKVNDRCFDAETYIDCRDCIKEYFKKKVEDK